MKLSKCCDALPIDNMEEYGICGKCKEHCGFYELRCKNTWHELMPHIDLRLIGARCRDCGESI